MSEEVARFFPYSSFRPFQDKFALRVYAAAASRKDAVLEGVNGLGKTAAILAALLPTVKQRGLSIIYTSRTHRQCDRAIEELEKIAKKASVTGISFRGRREMCANKFVLQNSDDTRTAMELCNHLVKTHGCSFYENTESNPRTLRKLLREFSSGVFTSSMIKERCSEFDLCPYEVAKRLLSNVDVVALSYYYVLDKNIRANFFRYFQKGLRRSIIVFDESHNLPEACKEVASEGLTLQSIRLAEIEAHQRRQKRLQKICMQIAEVLQEIAERANEEEELIEPKEFVSVLKRRLGTQDLATVAQRLEDAGEKNVIERLAEGRSPRSNIRRVGTFLKTWLETSSKETFAHVMSFRDRENRRNPALEIISLDPRDTAKEVLSSAYATISTSGTLEPLDSFREIMGIPEGAITESFPAPYAPDQILCIAVSGTTTKLNARNPDMYEKTARRIAVVSSSAPENIGVFAASYDVLEGLREAGIEDMIRKPLFWERSGSTSGESDELIYQFKQQAGKGGGVLMAVAGGRSSEGADFPGKEMTTSVVVGVPYPRPTATVRAEIEYMERTYPERGKLYGYTLPAIRKASQSAGRAVRSITDRSAIVLLDSRFATQYCKRYLPRWIRENLSNMPDDDELLARRIASFFATNSDK
jgi:DNA excision repair protein ERCC-2